VLADETGLLLIDCRSETVTLVPLCDEDVSVLIMNTNVRHALGDGEYARRRADCAEAAKLLGTGTLREATLEQVQAQQNRLGERLYRRARHVVSENERTVQAARALRAGDLGQVGTLMYESHRSLRDDYEVSCAELDVLVDEARSLGLAEGVYGARMTGGGFGGCTVGLVRSDRVADVAGRVAHQYAARTGRASSYFVTRPAQGAHVLEGDASE
jgi:galactokinase